MTTPTELYETHRELLDRAIAAAGTRDYWSAYPGVAQQVRLRRGRRPGRRAGVPRAARTPTSRSTCPARSGSVATERSPYGFDLGVRYPKADPAALVAAAKRRHPRLARRRPAGPRRGRRRDPPADQRALLRDGARRAAHHRPGVRDGLPGRRPARPGPRPRGGGVRAGRHHPHAGPAATWSKPQRGGDPLTMAKTSTPVGRGVALVIGCNTFPTWNSYPACSPAWSPATR